MQRDSKRPNCESQAKKTQQPGNIIVIVICIVIFVSAIFTIYHLLFNISHPVIHRREKLIFGKRRYPKCWFGLALCASFSWCVCLFLTVCSPPFCDRSVEFDGSHGVGTEEPRRTRRKTAEGCRASSSRRGRA